VTVGPLVLFSTETGDAWLLDPADHLAARLARDGVPPTTTSNLLRFPGWLELPQHRNQFTIFVRTRITR
jgi:hypothetical protein